jgi:CubicO group peptidase (beta-lactamase class C family)
MRPALKAWGVYFAAAVLLGFAPVTPVSVRCFGLPDEGKGSDKAEAAVSEDLRDELRSAMRKPIADGTVEGMVHLVVLNGKTIYSEAAGYRDVADKKPFKADTIVRIYSMSKPLTSVAAMTLFDKGKFKLDDPVAIYIPAFKDAKVLEGKGKEAKLVEPNRLITVRDVLCHATGYGYGFEEEVYKYYAKEGLTGSGPLGMFPPKMTIEKLADGLARIPALHQPGERFTYGYNADLLGRLIEIWSGNSLDRYMREAVFEPLGMVDTGFSVPKDKLDRFASCYTTEDGKLVVIDAAATSPYGKGFECLSGGGGMVSTANDYANFCQMIVGGGEFRGKRVLKATTVALMLEDQGLEASVGPYKFRVGLGFAISKVKIGKEKTQRDAHYYSWDGYGSTSFRIVPSEKLVQIVLRQQIPPAFTLNEELIQHVYSGITLPAASSSRTVQSR